jgi:23S rRNA U2552 (ribose-2'-O)-methylase RlmE/FtsJ
MYIKLISSHDALPPIVEKAPKSYNVDQLMKIKESLNKTKSLLDDKVTDVKFMKLWKENDPYKSERQLIKKMIQSPNDISKAWLKCTEIITAMELIPDKAHTYVTFDNAAFPGSFILAINHYVATKTHIKDHKWFASSLLTEKKNTIEGEYTLSSKYALDDSYGLYSKYPEKWLMNEKYNGEKLGGSVDLYTSDLGFDIGEEYESQEISHIKFNAGQVLSGLLVLKKGGNLVIKQYTCFETHTLNILIVLIHFFQMCYLCKPNTSRDTNSETYIVCKNFLGGVYLNHPYIQFLFDIIDGKNVSLAADKYSRIIYSKVVQISKELFSNQERAIKDLIAAIIKIHGKDNGKDSGKDNTLIEYLYSYENEIAEWYRVMRLLPQL